MMDLHAEVKRLRNQLKESANFLSKMIGSGFQVQPATSSAEPGSPFKGYNRFRDGENSKLETNSNDITNHDRQLTQVVFDKKQKIVIKAL